VRISMLEMKVTLVHFHGVGGKSVMTAMMAETNKQAAREIGPQMHSSVSQLHRMLAGNWHQGAKNRPPDSSQWTLTKMVIARNIAQVTDPHYRLIYGRLYSTSRRGVL